ncbi:MAG: dockerin type I domain-containing protein [Planctomycetota bacterium]|nr:dockerin type I domain-containing protein [Planctomycetota bacterium]
MTSFSINFLHQRFAVHEISLASDEQRTGADFGNQPGTFDLDKLLLKNADGSLGLVLRGAGAGDAIGNAVSGAVDVDRDGFDDVILGAGAAGSAGEAYVFYGPSPAETVTSLDVSSLDGANGFVVPGIDPGDTAGSAVASLGDVNGDGIDDFVIGAPNADVPATPVVSSSGEAYVVFGTPAGLQSPFDLTQLDGRNGFVFRGRNASELIGARVSAAGDINGDGLADVAIGSAKFSFAGEFVEMYVVFGRSAFAAALFPDALNGSNGFTIQTPDLGQGLIATGFAFDSAGDVNGDGIDDLVLGAPFTDRTFDGGFTANDAGAAYVVFGQSNRFPATVELAQLNGQNGFVFQGDTALQLVGISVSGIGDVDDDGIDDVAIGSRGTQGFGQAFVLFGRSDGFAASIEPNDLTGGLGTTVFLNSTASQSLRVNAAGDVNADGVEDFVLGANRFGQSAEGAAFLVFGNSAGFPSSMLLDDLDATRGLVLSGAASDDLTGSAVAAAGDVNGDGFDDLLIGAPGADVPDGSGGTIADAGRAYVYYGSNLSNLPNIDARGPDADTLTGTPGADVLIGGAGDDTVVGGGGADVLRGGQGDDVLAIADLTFQQIDGGNGFDTLRLDTTGLTFDLATIPDNRITGIEAIDITGLSPNRLMFGLRDVLNLSDESNTLRVIGDADDTVLISSGWQPLVNEVIDGQTFKQFQRRNATLLVSDAVIIDQGGRCQLSDLLTGAGDCISGFVINGRAANGLAGFSVSSVGDFDGDGFDDLVVGASNASPNGLIGAGEVYVIYGREDGFPAEINLDDIATGDGSLGFALAGTDAGDAAGFAVSSAGDFDADGFDELLIGVPGERTNNKDGTGRVYVLFGGSRDRFDGEFLLNVASVDDNPNGTGVLGIVINGQFGGDRAGIAVGSAGDVNGDGYGDLLIGSTDADPAGQVYIVFGGDRDRFNASDIALDLSDFEAGDGTVGFTIYGNNSGGDELGFSASAVGDFDGDGYDDLVVGDPAFGDTADSGRSYLIYGAPGGFGGTVLVHELALGDGSAGFVIDGPLLNGRNGHAVSGAGDINDDGLADLVVTASNAAEAYVVFGGTRNRFGSVLDPTTLAVADGTQGFLIVGAGISASAVGDLNGDGIDDLLIGESRDLSGAGASFVLFGACQDCFPPVLDLGDLDGNSGLLLVGIDIRGISDNVADQSGFSVSEAGDVNGDGFDDIIIGAHGGDASGNLIPDAGESYVVFGGDFTGEVTQLGTDAAPDKSDRLVGTIVRDVLIGGQGNDELIGNGGLDVLRGGQGDDILAITDLGFQRIDGGHGFDTLRLDGGGAVLNLSDPQLGRLTDIEQIDLSGAGVNVVIITPRNVREVTESLNTLLVIGDADDAVRLAGDWALTGLETLGGQGFRIYRATGTTLKVAANVRTSAPRFFELSSLLPESGGNGSMGLVLQGIDPGDISGGSVSSVGDINGDGFDDLIIGASFADGADNSVPDAGESYVVFGGNQGFRDGQGVLNLSELDGQNGFVLRGIDSRDFSGVSVSAAGDVNGDGFDDLIIGATTAGGADNSVPDAGESYVVFGGDQGFGNGQGVLNLADLNGQNGFVFRGIDPGDLSGVSVSAAGDVNGDGFDDLIIGARIADGADNSVLNAGESYVVFGADFSLSVTAQGGANNDRLVGTDADDVLIGGEGNDELIGNGGVDVLRGGEGDDLLALTDVSVLLNCDAQACGRVVGGNGTDTLRVDGLQANLDLTAIADNRITGIEIIDVRAALFGSLTLDLLEVLNISDESNTLTVLALAGNTIDIGDGWNAGRIEVVEGHIFSVYQQGVATLRIQSRIDLAGLSSATGVTLTGTTDGDRAGFSVSAAGDVNRDGYDDVIVGAPNANPNGGGSGASYVVFGGASLGGEMPLAELQLANGGNGTQGFVLNGIDIGDGSGFSVSDAGDVNGDGIGDLLIGAPFGSQPSSNPSLAAVGEAYVVFGQLNRFDAEFELSSLLPGNGGDGTRGFVINGVNVGDNTGFSVSSAGDINGDGYDDLLIAAAHADVNDIRSGATYVVFGKATGFPAELELFRLRAAAFGDGRDGFVINGVNGSDDSGASVRSAGDVNGDGIDDLIIGAPAPTSILPGAAFVVFGTTDGFDAEFELSSLTNAGGGDGTRGFVFPGLSGNDQFGTSVSAAGDVNGDGLDDVLIGSPTRSFVVYGKRGGFPAEFSLTTFALSDDADGFRITGAGGAVSSAGDFNGDGFDDLLIGAPSFSRPGELFVGQSFLVFGRAEFDNAISLLDLDGSDGFALNGVGGGDASGMSVGAVGDVNGDGFDDLIIGTDPAAGAGTSYILFGADFIGTVAAVGTDRSETLSGNIVIGGRGNDTLIGQGSSQVLRGGVGSDIFEVGPNIRRIDGGNSIDTLRPGGTNQPLYLGPAADHVFPGIPDNRISGIERIDLRENGFNYLAINVREVLNISDETNTVTVLGDSQDLIDIGAGWELRETQRIGGTSFNVFQHMKFPSAELMIAAEVPIAIRLSDQNRGGTFEAILDTGKIVVREAGRQDVFRAPFGTLPSLVIVGSNEDDELIVNFRNGDFIPVGGLTFHGGAEVTRDKLEFRDQLSSDAFGVVTHSATSNLASGFFAPNGFSGTVDFDRSIVRYTGVEPVIDNTQATNRTFEFSLSSIVSVLDDDRSIIPGVVGIDGDILGQSLISYCTIGRSCEQPTLLQRFQFISFANPTTSLAIIGGSLDDFLEIVSLDPTFAASLHFEGRDGNDIIRLDESRLPASAYGGQGNDTIVGTPYDDRLDGGDGDDILSGNGGNDILRGNDGDDTLTVAGPLFQAADGGPGIDRLVFTRSSAAINVAQSPHQFREVEIIDLTTSGRNVLTLDLASVLNITGDAAKLEVLATTIDTVSLGSGWSYEGREVIDGLPFDIFLQGGATVRVSTEATVAEFLIFQAPTITTANELTLRRENVFELVLESNGVEVARQPLVDNMTVIVTGADDIDDTLTVDFSGGNPVPGGGVRYAGGAAGFDTLRIVQGVAQSVTHVFENRSDGQVEIDGTVIAYTGLEPIIDHIQAVDRFFTFLGLSNEINLGDDDVSGNSVSRISSVASSETVDFLNPAASLTVYTGQGDDITRVNSLDAGPVGGELSFAVDINGQGGNNTLDASQSADPLSLIGTAGDDVLSIGTAKFRRIDGAAGTDTLRLTGANIDLRLPGLASNRLTGLEVLDIRGSGDNALTLDFNSVVNLSPTSDALLVRHDEGDVVSYGAGWKAERPQFINGQYTHVLTQNVAVISVVNTKAWQNPLNPLDSNRDGKVSPLDALVIVNTLNTKGPGPLATPNSTDKVPEFYVDSTGDRHVSPLDALVVVNFLNKPGRVAEGEEERPELRYSGIAPVVPSLPLLFGRVDGELNLAAKIHDSRLLASLSVVPESGMDDSFLTARTHSMRFLLTAQRRSASVAEWDDEFSQLLELLAQDTLIAESSL